MTAKLLKIQEVAERLGVSRGMIYNGIAKNSPRPFPVRPIRIGGAVRFRESDIERFIQGGTDHEK